MSLESAEGTYLDLNRRHTPLFSQPGICGGCDDTYPCPPALAAGELEDLIEFVKKLRPWATTYPVLQDLLRDHRLDSRDE